MVLEGQDFRKPSRMRSGLFVDICIGGIRLGIGQSCGCREAVNVLEAIERPTATLGPSCDHDQILGCELERERCSRPGGPAHPLFQVRHLVEYADPMAAEPVSATVRTVGADRGAGRSARGNRQGHRACHAYRDPQTADGRRPNDADRTATDGALLEIGVLDLDGEGPVVIHAMPLRPKFYRLLGGR